MGVSQIRRHTVLPLTLVTVVHTSRYTDTVDIFYNQTDIALNFYRRNAQTKPKRVIFYRDGVSESQVRVLGFPKSGDTVLTVYQAIVQYTSNTGLTLFLRNNSSKPF